jgi:hypothetical protein
MFTELIDLLHEALFYEILMKVRHRDVQEFVHGHTALWWHSQFTFLSSPQSPELSPGSGCPISAPNRITASYRSTSCCIYGWRAAFLLSAEQICIFLLFSSSEV